MLSVISLTLLFQPTESSQPQCATTLKRRPRYGPDLWAIGANMLDPFPTSGTSLRIRLTSVTMQSTKKATVDWSEPSNWTKHTNSDKAITDITTDQIAVGESLILTEVEYDYDSPIGNFFKTGTVFKDAFMHHPRNGSVVTCPLCT